MDDYERTMWEYRFRTYTPLMLVKVMERGHDNAPIAAAELDRQLLAMGCKPAKPESN